MCFTAPHIYFPVVVICFFPADAIFHETRQHNWVPSHFISVPCQGASEHDINIHLFLYSCTVQPSLLSEMLTLHWAFWIMKSSCHASGWLWSYLSTLLKDKTVHKTSQNLVFHILKYEVCYSGNQMSFPLMWFMKQIVQNLNAHSQGSGIYFYYYFNNKKT